MATTRSILGTTTYGTPSGNYDGSSMDWASDAVQAAGYYRGYGGLQTVTFSFSNFVGVIHVEATLDEIAEDANWTEVYLIGDHSTAMSGIYAPTLTGNFAWMRVRVDFFDAGTINYVNITY